MKTILKQLAENIKSNLVRDMYDDQIGDDTTLVVLDAYNRYKEEEHDGVDYIFSIDKSEDLKCCIDGGMTALEISCLYNECNVNGKSTPFFVFGHNHPQAETFENWKCLKKYLTFFLDEIIMCMLAYHQVKEYRYLYNHCITNYMIDNNLV